MDLAGCSHFDPTGKAKGNKKKKGNKYGGRNKECSADCMRSDEYLTRLTIQIPILPDFSSRTLISQRTRRLVISRITSFFFHTAVRF